MLLVVILGLLLIGNWALSETLVFLPLNLLDRLTFFGWWGGLFLFLLFLAWCIGDD